MASRSEDAEGGHLSARRTSGSRDTETNVVGRVPSAALSRPRGATRDTDTSSARRMSSLRNVTSSRTGRTRRSYGSWRSEDVPTRSLFSSDLQQLPQHQLLGLAEDGYYEENPWHGKSSQKPIFSLGKPLPHKVRRRTRKPRNVILKHDEEMGDIAEVVEEEEGLEDDGRISGENLATRTASGQPSRTRTQGSENARELQRQQEMMTEAGAAHSDKRNDAGQPVFDYIPEDTDPAERLASHATTRTRSNKQAEPPDFEIDKTPLGHEEQSDVEKDEVDPDELRNWWARLRARHPEPLAEFLATGVAVFLGLASTLSVNLSANQTTKYGDYETSCWAWGFAWMFGIYLGGGVSGAHMNPSVSISLSIFRGFPWKQCAVYVVVQFIASIVAGALAYGIYAESINYADPQKMDMSKTFFSTPREWVSMGSAFFNQVVGGAIMMTAVLALGDDQNNPPGAGMHALVLGLLVTTLKFTLGYNVGSALNPASDFGPRVIAYAVGFREPNVFKSGWWFYGPWLGTVVGSVLGCVIYDGFIFVGSESPVNYRPSRELKDRVRRIVRRK
ncbi:aquaporin-like protein [Coniochaeta ligniaria NRRL 30616]|uniref:Aquaporin-like protein n=1 Tax=Coniochaeta ligniaria NRRL 30616 TaxID=1408157 RepID=A0A1J7IZ50_9PEZI|nr:aquaporin-like protein [Coniochaeta ligniaria NRRL 30616]